MVKWFLITAAAISTVVALASGYWILGMIFFLLVIYYGAWKVILMELVCGMLKYHHDRTDARARRQELNAAIDRAYAEHHKSSVYIDKCVITNSKDFK